MSWRCWWNVFFFSCLLISPRGTHSCNCDVLYIPLQCLTQNPKAERNSKKIPLSCCHKADKYCCCRTQGTDLYCKFFHRECQWHKQRNKKRKILISLFTLFTWCRLKYKNKMTTLHLVSCQHVVELFMLQHFEYFFFMATNCSLCQICRHDRWGFCINMHRRHALCDSCTAHISTRCQVEHLPILLYCKMKSPFYKYHNLWIFVKIYTKTE